MDLRQGEDQKIPSATVLPPFMDSIRFDSVRMHKVRRFGDRLVETGGLMIELVTISLIGFAIGWWCCRRWDKGKDS